MDLYDDSKNILNENLLHNSSDTEPNLIIYSKFMGIHDELGMRTLYNTAS